MRLYLSHVRQKGTGWLVLRTSLSVTSAFSVHEKVDVCVLSLDTECLSRSPLLTIAFLPLYHKVSKYAAFLAGLYSAP